MRLTTVMMTREPRGKIRGDAASGLSMTPSSRIRNLVAGLLAPGSVPSPALALLWLAGVGVGLAGYLHGHLYHQGYAHVFVVGPLFLLNVIGSGVVIVTLLLRRYAVFAGGALSISLGAVVSILISHTTSFFGFAEHAYGWRAATIVIAESVAAVATVLALAIARRRILPTPDRALGEPGAPRTAPLRELLAAGTIASTASFVVLAATVLVAVGVGQGSPPPQRPVSAAAVSRELTALAHASGPVARGEVLFSAHGCSDCHTIAAGGSTGQLGPRLDAEPLPAAAVTAFIAHPPQGIPGFQSGLMPENFAHRLAARDIDDIAAFVAAASKAAG
jgi:mono/diheme cytochrome c family protein